MAMIVLQFLWQKSAQCQCVWYIRKVDPLSGQRKPSRAIRGSISMDRQLWMTWIDSSGWRKLLFFSVKCSHADISEKNRIGQLGRAYTHTHINTHTHKHTHYKKVMFTAPNTHTHTHRHKHTHKHTHTLQEKQWWCLLHHTHTHTHTHCKKVMFTALNTHTHTHKTHFNTVPGLNCSNGLQQLSNRLQSV